MAELDAEESHSSEDSAGWLSFGADPDGTASDDDDSTGSLDYGLVGSTEEDYSENWMDVASGSSISESRSDSGLGWDSGSA